MLYFSALQGARVLDNANLPVGTLIDLVVPADGQFPVVAAVVVRARSGGEQLVPMDTVEMIGLGMVTLNKGRDNLKPHERQRHEIRLKNAVLDRQVVDTEGIKVVRANDIVLGEVKGALSVISIDVGMRGILRRMGIENWPLLRRLNPQFVPWTEVSLVESNMPQVQLKTKQNALHHIHPADIANLVEDLNAKRGAELVSSLHPDMAADVLEEVDEDHQLAILEHLDPEKAKTILQGMSPDQAADLLDELPADQSLRLISGLKPEEGRKILELISYDDETAGGLMTTEVFTARAENTVAEVRAALLRTIDAIPTVTYIYVTDTHNVLRGVLSLRLLAVAPDKQRLDEIMTTNLFTVGPDMGWKDVAAALTKYNLYSIAVVDEGGQLLGIVIIDDVMRQIFPEA